MALLGTFLDVNALPNRLGLLEALHLRPSLLGGLSDLSPGLELFASTLFCHLLLLALHLLRQLGTSGLLPLPFLMSQSTFTSLVEQALSYLQVRPRIVAAYIPDGVRLTA